jgi:hypothetical protein
VFQGFSPLFKDPHQQRTNQEHRQASQIHKTLLITIRIPVPGTEMVIPVMSLSIILCWNPLLKLSVFSLSQWTQAGWLELNHPL